MHPSGSTPIVEGMGFAGNLFNIMGFGVSYKTSLDALIGFDMPVFYLNSAGNNVAFTPNLYVEAASHNYIDIGLGEFTFRFNLDFIGFKYNAAQLSYVWSIDNP